MLGINLKSGKDEEIVKWFLASILYSKPIRESSATKTYFCFLKHGVTNAKKNPPDRLARVGRHSR